MGGKSGAGPLAKMPAATSTAHAAPANNGNNGMLALVYCVLLSMQFGLQPTLVKSFTPNELSKKTIVIATEISKIVITYVTIATEAGEERAKIWQQWSLADSLEQAAVPAILYAVQNVLTQYGYQLLDSMTFNLLNQTKIISAALCLFLFMGKRQTLRQCVALVVLLQAALLLSLPKDIMSTAAAAAAAVMPAVRGHIEASQLGLALQAALAVPQTIVSSLAQAASASNVDSSTYQRGVACVLGASLLSGVCAMLTQKVLQGGRRHALFYSAEMAVYGIAALLVSSMGVAFDKEGMQWDVRGGLAELGRGVGMDAAWVMVPVLVNVSRSFSSVLFSFPLVFLMHLLLSAPRLPSLSPITPPPTHVHTYISGLRRPHRGPGDEVRGRRQQGLRRHRRPLSLGRGAVGA